VGACRRQAGVAATPVPHAEILEHIKPALAKEGVDLKVKVFTDYVQPQVDQEKQVDANFFQHQPYLEQFNKSQARYLVPVAKVHIEPSPPIPEVQEGG
jgi:D-methionine transport system substrate-binding protein